MRRSRIIVVAVLAAVVGAIVPIAAMLYVASKLTVKAEQDRLAEFADRAITRANVSYAQATHALQVMNASKVAPCSPEHIAQMRALTMNTRSIEEVGYFENHLLKCTSWGGTEDTIQQSSPTFTTADGTVVTLRSSGGTAMMALRSGSYDVLVEPMRYVDVIVDPGIRLAVASEQGKLISASPGAEPALLQSLPALPSRGWEDDYLFAVVRKDGWIAIAMEPYADVASRLWRRQLLWLPVGLFISAFIVGIVIWLLRRRLSLLGELTLAVQNKEFLVHYQPIIELETGRCVGAEGLVRWQRPGGRMVPPDLFIPLAEESGLVAQITEQVLDHVVSDLNGILVADRSLHVSINLSASELESGRILPVIKNAIQHTGIRPQQIWLEVTERALMDVKSACATIAKARATGHAVLIDDFGTGYSSLQYLHDLPVDALKIDKSFIDTIGMEAATSSVTSYIIDMAKTLKLQIVAEGIERQAQLEYLRARGVEFGQGWLFAKALAPDEFIAFCRDRLIPSGRNEPHPG